MSESWVAELTAGDTPLYRVLNHQPAYAAALRDLEAAIWSQTAVDVVLLELCRLRVAQLLGCTPESSRRTPEAVAAGLDEEQVAALSQWPTSPSFSPRDRVCLAYAEQHVIDPHGITDEQAQTVIAALSVPGYLALTYACGVFEALQRATLVLGIGRSA